MGTGRKEKADRCTARVPNEVGGGKRRCLRGTWVVIDGKKLCKVHAKRLHGVSPLQRYLMFGGSGFVPEGGWEDFVDSAASAETLRDKAVGDDLRWWQVIDSRSRAILFSNENPK